MSNAKKHQVYYKEHGNKFYQIIEFESRTIVAAYEKFKQKFPDIEPKGIVRK